MPEPLLENVSPLGNVQAIVEVDDRTCFFYLFGAPESDLGVKSVWVRNLQPAPAKLDVEGMAEARPPMNPAAHCRDKGAGARPRGENLRVCWFPEGNGAALFEAERMLALIPPWSGTSGFHGYSAECLGQGPLAWQMPGEPGELFARIAAAEVFWRTWETDPWPGIQQTMLSAIERRLGSHSNYYAIDGGNWPPRALVRIATGAGVALVTLGMCLLPQPNVEMYVEDPASLRRVEIGVLLPRGWSEHDITQFGSYLSGQAQLPWEKFTWFGPGHTIPCNAWRNRKFTAAVLIREHPAVPALELPRQFSDPVSILWFLPIGAEERELAMETGTDELLKALAADRWKEA